MKSEESVEKRSRELEKRVLERVDHTITSINVSKHVDEVISALYSLAACLFPLDPRSFLGSVGEKYRNELHAVEVPSENERSEWCKVFYKGSSFHAFARVLLYDVASSWLSCFPISARKHLYDLFFVKGSTAEVVQLVVPCLQPSRNDSTDIDSVCANAERLLVLCLLENDGVLQLVKEFAGCYRSEDLSHEQIKQIISRVTQLVTAIPDKARRGAPTSLSPHLFFKRITTQLLNGIEECSMNLFDEASVLDETNINDAILFVGEVFARVCRRGSADVLLSEVIRQLLGHVRSLLSSTTNLAETIKSRHDCHFWLKIMEAIKDPYSVERIAEQVLHQLAAKNATDVEGYWILWILFHSTYKHQLSIRSTFVEKFLLWKVFPICCLRWILHFAVLECPPDNTSSVKSYNGRGLSDTVHRLVATWSKREFLQSAPTEQQIYITAALGLCLETMTKEDLDATKGALQSILEGVSCRLESPIYLVRKMASSIAYVFSKIIDPQNPLYLDESCQVEPIDWEFGIANPNKGSLAPAIRSKGEKVNKSDGDDDGNDDAVKSRKKRPSILKLIDPDEVIDPATLDDESLSDEDDSGNDSEDSEASTDPSLQPYDLTDDDSDLKRKFSQLVDVVGALRKTDDAEGVERALDVAENLVRASPDELKFIAGDMVRALVQVRCSEITVEGEEDSAEGKRQKALVALIVTSPLESLDSLNKLLYSPNVDISQRIMILDVMTDAAEELANSRIQIPRQQSKTLISSTSDQPWFIPSSKGPPGAGSWKEISYTPLNWAYSYERELPPRRGQVKKGKTRRWNLKSMMLENQTGTHQTEWSQNRFPEYAAAFMLPAMQGFDKKRQGVDLLGRDFVVLGKLIHMLGVCIKCAAMHPEASVLASPLLDMLRSREISHHAEPYVRRSVLFAASCILLALHPSYVASAVVEGNTEVSKGLEWVRTWALQVAESDTDRECYTLAMTCLQLHAEKALQASRALESAEDTFKFKSINLTPSASKLSIKLPYSNALL